MTRLLLALALVACTAPAQPTGAGERSVAVVDFSYRPARLTVPLGTTVTWTNYDIFGHTVTSASAALDGGLGETTNGRGTTFTHTFEAAGTFRYHCDFHPDMRGTVTAVPIGSVDS